MLTDFHFILFSFENHQEATDKMKYAIIFLCFQVIVQVVLSHGKPTTPSPTQSKVILDVPKAVKRFTQLIKKSKKSIFHKSKGFKWGCGKICGKYKRTHKVTDESVNVGNNFFTNGTKPFKSNRQDIARVIKKSKRFQNWRDIPMVRIFYWF